MIVWEKDTSGLSVADIERKQPYTLEPHVFISTRKLPWLRCQRCGLLNLRNELTAWAVKVGCNARAHPEFAARCKNSRANNSPRSY